MFNSLRFKILIVITLLIILNFTTVMFIVDNEMNSTIKKIERDNAHNLLNTVLLNVESEYESILFHEQTILEHHRKELLYVTQLAVNTIEKYHLDAENGRISETQAQERAIEAIDNFRYGNNEYFFVVSNNRTLSHPDPVEIGRDVSGLKDVSGFEFMKELLRVAQNEGGGYTTYFWQRNNNLKPVPKISYSTYFDPWGWMIGTGVYVDDIEQGVTERKEAVINELRNTFQKLKIIENGYLFLFTGDEEILIHPRYTGLDSETLINPGSDNNMITDFIESYHNNEPYYEYLWDKVPEYEGNYTFRKKAYIRYMEPLDWYIVLSFYVEDLEKVTNELSSRIFFISVTFLLLAIFLSIVLSRNLSSSLKKLTDASRGILDKGLNSSSIPVDGTIETRELGTLIKNIISTLQLKEKELRKTNEMLLHVIGSIPQLIYWKDRNSIYMGCNKNFAQFAGFEKPEDVIGLTEYDIYKNKKIIESSILWDNQVMESNKADINILKTAISTNEEELFCRINKIPLHNSKGIVTGILITEEDVTNQVRTGEIEKALEQASKMAEIGALSTGIAHEIRNPLAGIIQNTQVLKKRIFDKNLKINKQIAAENNTSLDNIITYLEKREIGRIIEGIAESGLRAEKIIKSMLSYTRYSDIQYKEEDLIDLIKETLYFAEFSKMYDELSEVLFLEPKEKIFIQCHKTEIQQVLLNIINNGLQAMALKKETDKKFEPQLSIHILLSEEKIIIEIADNGPGMNKKTVNRIFQPFYTTKEVGNGTGLGLYICSQIIKENHKGNLEVETSEGIGTKFKIELPMFQNR